METLVKFVDNGVTDSSGMLLRLAGIRIRNYDVTQQVEMV